MKVVHLLKTGIGGAWAWRQIKALKRLGVDIEVILAEHGAMEAVAADAGIPVHILPSDLARLRSPRKLLTARRQFRALIGDIQPDIIHSHFVGSAMFARLAMRPGSRIPRIFQVPGPLHLEHRATRLAEIWTSDSRDYWLGSCQLTCRIYARSGISPDRIGLSYYGGDIRDFPDPDPTKVRRELGLGPETRLAGMIAYFYAPKKWLGQQRGLKGHEDLIDAVAMLCERRDDVTVLFAGSAWGSAKPYEEQVKRYAADKLGGKAIFLGFRSDVADVYAALDVAVHPSHSENLGGAGESLALGTPTIASRTGGLPDIVRDHETGLLFTPGDPPDLARALDAMFADPEAGARMARAGQAWVLENLNIERTARTALSFYEHVLAREAGRF